MDKVSRFTNSSICDQIGSALLDAVNEGKPTGNRIAQRDSHNNYFERERRGYRRNVELAKAKPSKYISPVVDGANQSKFTLPHFVTSTIDKRGHGLSIYLVGSVMHAPISVVRLLTMTANHATCATHVIESVDCVLNDMHLTGSLPRQLLLQLDNCSKEKNTR